MKLSDGLNVSSKPILVITGPTGVGKTAISLALARYFGGDIINADASQLYKGLDIGTAKITPQEMGDIPHHLFSFLNPTERFSIKTYQETVRTLMDQLSRPMMVGGSGLYIRATITDYDLSTSSANGEDDQTLSNQTLHDRLAKIDPDLAQSTHPNNRRRIIRYLELASDRGYIIPKEPTLLYNTLVLCLTRPRLLLYERINQRVLLMLQSGWVEEVKGLVNQGIDISQIKEIGYREIESYLQGRLSYEAMIDLIQQKTRHYAKRQMTWFRHQLPSVMIDCETTSLETIIDRVKNFYEQDTHPCL